MRVSWKGHTFNQIITKMKKNAGSIVGLNKFLPPPVKNYRREIDTEDNCSRATISLADFFRPGATIVNSATDAGVYTVDVNLTNDSTEKPIMGACSIRAENAKRRLRSGGNIKQTLSQNSSICKYYTSSGQYLENRNLGFEQNNYRNLRIGEPTFSIGIPSTRQNVYMPNGISRKPKVQITGFNTEEFPLFKYRWVNGIEYNVTIADGEYNLEELNQVIIDIQVKNYHYLIDLHVNRVKIIFIKFVYDTYSNRIQIQCSGMDSKLFDSTRYETWTSYALKVDWEVPEYTLIPNIILLDNIFLEVIGFESPGYYPPEKINNTAPFTQPDTNANPIDNVSIGKNNYYIMGSIKPKITTQFDPIIYKPQGGVSSSSNVSRLRYVTITGATTEYTTPLGRSVASALAYNIPAPGYSQKYVAGYTNSTCKMSNC